MADICDLANERNLGLFVCDNTVKTLDLILTSGDNFTYSLELQDGTACTFVLNGNDIISLSLTNVPNDATPINNILNDIIVLLNEQANLADITIQAQIATAQANIAIDKANIATDKEALMNPHYVAIDSIYLNQTAILAVGNELISSDILEYIGNDLLLLDDSEIKKVNSNKANIDIVAGINADVISLALIKEKLESLYTDKITLDSLYADKVTLDSIYADKAKLDSIYADKNKLDSLYADKAILDSLFNDKATLDSLFTDKVQLDSLFADKAKLDSIYADKSKLDIVYDNLTNIANVSDNMTDVQAAVASATKAELESWEAEALKMTTNSYANEAEDVYVKVYTSNGDGTFSSTDIAEYSSFHWSQKSESSSGDSLAIDNNLSDLSDPIAARENLGLNAILDSVTQSIANLATAQAVIVDDGDAIDIDTTQKLVPIMTDTPSTDTNIIDIDDANDTLTIKTNASVNFFSAMAFTSSTPNTRNISIKVVNVADDVTLKCFDMALTIPNGTSDTVAHTFLLTVGKNGTPSAPLTVRFEIVADDTGYTLDSFRAVIATSSSYDVSTYATGINYDNSLSTIAAENVQDALDEALDINKIDLKLGLKYEGLL